jgi:hypothetical protein
MTILEITVQRKAGETWPVVVEHSRPDAISPIRTESELRLGGGERNGSISSEGGTDHVRTTTLL